MSTTRQDKLSVKCPGCGGTFVLTREMAGRRGRCSKCGTTIKIPALAGEPSSAKLIGVLCRLCDTPLYGTPDRIGQELKCPDCGARTRLKAPPPKRKNVPAAMEGEQYELWDDDVPQPYRVAGSALPESIPVNCRLCDTLMYATLQQVGSELTCPDCNSKTLVAPPKPVVPADPVQVSDGQEYELLPAEVSPGVQSPLDPELKRRLVEADEAGRGGSQFDTEQQIQRRQKRQLDSRGRPILPRWPTVTGVFPFLGSPGVVPRVAVMTCCWSLVGLMLLFCLAVLSNVRASGEMAFLGVFVLAGLVIIGWIVYSATAAIFVSVVVESSEGNDEVCNWPSSNMGDWFGEAFYLAVAATIAAAPGWLVVRYSDIGSLGFAPAAAISAWFLFPIVFLSQLDASSAAAILSMRVLAGLGRCLLTWFVFLVESAVLVALVGGVCVLGIALHPGLLLLAPPTIVVAGLVYARMLGRLAWAIAEATPEDDPVAENHD